jgi:hypothetical protein
VPSNNARDRAKGPRLGIQVDATTTFTRGGQHQLKGGVQLDRLGIDVLGGATGNVTSVFWGLAFNGMQGRYGYYVLGSNDIIPNRGFLTRGAATVNNLGLFLQDAWSAGRRLTLHLGLRTENEHVPSLSPDPSIPPTAIHFGFADKLAPRLGAAWDATGDGRTKVYGSWGVFYDITKLQMTIGFGAFSNRVYHFTLDNGDLGTIVDNPDCPPACPGTLIAGPAGIGGAINDPARDLIDPDLDQMRLREGVVGVEREIGSTLTFRARYVRKHLDRTIEDVGTRRSAEAEPSIQIANPGYGRVTEFYPAGGTTPVATSNAIRDYDAVEVGMDRRLANRWSARVSYLWSRLHGNYSGLAASDEDGRVAPNTTGSFDYPLMTFDERGQPIAGPLGTDRTHQVKANVLVDLPWGTSAGLGWFAGTGIPRTRDAFYEPGVPVQYRGRESDGRLPFLSQVDLHLQHYVRIDRRLTLTVSMNAFNLLNQAEATNYHQSELFPGQRLPVDEARIFNGGIDTQALIAQHGVVRDARFLMNSGFQAPRTVTLGVKLGF